MKKLITMILAITLVLSLGAVSASAADYTVKAKNTDDFYNSTLYEDMYSSQYNYGGQNVTDFYDPSALPEFISPTPQTVTADGTVYGYAGSYAETGIYDTSADYSSNSTSYTTTWETAFTSASDLKRSDGSIGTLYIPSLGITRKAYEGTGSDSMNKGVGHFPESSGWNGNVALCGHNRGSTYAIGSIKDLKTGDVIKYTTILGTRSYAVTFVGTVSSTDWAYLSATSDNRITIVTCLADQPTLRVIVQAKEIT